MANWTCISECEVACSGADFHSGVEVWLRRPNVVNKRVLGAVFLEDKPLEDLSTDSQWVEWLTKLCSDKSFQENERVMFSTGSRMIIRELLPKPRSMAPGREAVLIDKQNHCVVFVPLSSWPASDCVVGVSSSAAVNTDIVSPASPFGGGYMMRYRDEKAGRQRITMHTRSSNSDEATPTNGVTVPTSEWLATTLLPKIAQWSTENTHRAHSTQSQHVNRPHIPLDRYCQLYSQLKERYGPTLVQNWPEATDPHKFVYEDIAIATYLLVLWEEERRELGLVKKQSFIDLGCGNGLLVYLLSAEGHPGKGIDLRERKIWRMFGRKANLEVCTLTPSNSTLFPGFDWLLGNHSDELTPWIPLMAARTSYHTRYFVLPCCPHDFNKKFSRVDTHKSQYRSYLDYVRHIGEVMGFRVEEDTMRIPSSKRVCQIGRGRTYLPEDESEVDQRRREFLEAQCHHQGTNKSTSVVGLINSPDDVPCGGHMVGVDISEGKSNYARNVGDCNQREDSELKRMTSSENEELVKTSAIASDGVWTTSFKPRDAKEHVRNCSLVNPDIKQLIIDTLTDHLLKTEHYIKVQRCSCHCHAHSVTAAVPGNDESITSFPCGRDEVMDSEMPATKQRPSVYHCCSMLKTELHRQQLPGWDREAMTSGRTVDCQGTTVGGCPCQLWDDFTIEWNTGGKVHLNEAVKMFDRDVLRELKREFGGLQTLLRNEHQVFQVSQGFIQLRNWTERDHPSRKTPKPSSRCQQDTKKLLLKTKLCWFHEHHPQGCPRQACTCPYAHGIQELRSRPDFKAALDCSSVLQI